MRAAITRSLRATRVLATGMGSAIPALLGLPVLLFVGALCLVIVGLPTLPEALRAQRALTRFERDRAAAALGHPIPAPYRPARGGLRQRLLVMVRDPATWRDLIWQLVHGCLGLMFGFFAIALWPALLVEVSMPLWWWLLPRGTVSAIVPITTWPQALTLPLAQSALAVAALLWLVPAFARFQLWLAENLLGPDRAELTERVEQLTESRTEALEAHGAELRRI